jgi:predicted lipoprotein with Yx(FWY)xxD motif
MRAMAAPLAALTMLAFAACGGDDDDDDGGDAAEPTAATTTSEATAAPTTAGTTAPTPPPANAAVIKVVDAGTLGAILTNADGRTLYIFTNDTAGKSVCNGSCATAWPPMEAATAPKVEGAAGEFSIVTRDDGKKQVAHNGRPLYTYAGDQKAGDTTGEGVGGVWFVAKASGQQASAGATPAASAGSGGGDPYGY